jgi:hypothetical protein
MEYIQMLLKNLDLRIQWQSVIKTFLLLAYILHVIGCFWFTSSDFNIFDRKNWIRENELQDSS